MKLHTIKPAKGAVQSRKRIARGQGSGRGGTSTKGHKGDKSRAGHKDKRGFEGGQMPLQRVFPKRGFKNPNRVEYVPVNLARLQTIVDKHGLTAVTPEILADHKIIKRSDRVKVLAFGAITSKVTLKVHAISDKAKAAIEGAGGSVELV
ncbi:MAG: 50S ribosomal protein L15 [Saprospiraceae bacterium]|nr:50S ribosomal protein L15 [Saprospiraceae bacterium]MCB9312480.1 50S ribosomal protein L15 [Lewinellaceae bacterium]HRW75407.1 50S ribosomal protein L15 [Saprospiraceae bacterium]